MDVPIKLVDVNPAAGARLRHSFDFGYVEVLHLQISVDARSIFLGECRAQLLPAQLSQSHRRVPAHFALQKRHVACFCSCIISTVLLRKVTFLVRQSAKCAGHVLTMIRN